MSKEIMERLLFDAIISDTALGAKVNWVKPATAATKKKKERILAKLGIDYE